MSQLLALLVGYLFGSVSGARLVGRIYAPSKDLSTTKVVLDGSGASVENYGVSPSSLQARAGAPAGLRAAGIDILKASAPTLVALLIWPDGPEYILAASGAILGHVFPIYHRFVGGFGISPLLGALVVIDVRSAVVSLVLFGLLGVILGRVFIGIETWPIGLIPWFWVMGDWWALGFSILANTLYWWRSRTEAWGAVKSWRTDRRPWSERVKDFRKYPRYEEPAE